MLTRDIIEERYDRHLFELREKYPGVNAIDLKTAAAEVGFDPRSLKDKKKHFPMMKNGRKYRVRLDSLALWIARQET